MHHKISIMDSFSASIELEYDKLLTLESLTKVVLGIIVKVKNKHDAIPRPYGFLVDKMVVHGKCALLLLDYD